MCDSYHVIFRRELREKRIKRDLTISDDISSIYQASSIVVHIAVQAGEES